MWILLSQVPQNITHFVYLVFTLVKSKETISIDGLLHYLATRNADEHFATLRPVTHTPAVWILLSQVPQNITHFVYLVFTLVKSKET
ncbi:MAG: hypothetical protein AB7E31_16105, partial [Desulfitobacterium sp.]